MMRVLKPEVLMAVVLDLRTSFEEEDGSNVGGGCKGDKDIESQEQRRSREGVGLHGNSDEEQTCTVSFSEISRPFKIGEVRAVTTQGESSLLWVRRYKNDHESEFF